MYPDTIAACGANAARIAGLLAKAERGELAFMLPVGLVRDPNGMVVKDPDIAVQERLELVFQTFLKFRTIAKVMGVLNDRSLALPRRDRHGELRWARATVSAVAAILKNPAYAGAFVYGRIRLVTVRRVRAPAAAGSCARSGGEDATMAGAMAVRCSMSYQDLS